MSENLKICRYKAGKMEIRIHPDNNIIQYMQKEVQPCGLIIQLYSVRSCRVVSYDAVFSLSTADDAGQPQVIKVGKAFANRE